MDLFIFFYVLIPLSVFAIYLIYSIYPLLSKEISRTTSLYSQARNHSLALLTRFQNNPKIIIMNIVLGTIRSYVRNLVYGFFYGPKLSKNKITITYWFAGQWYQIPIKLIQGPKNQIDILGWNGHERESREGKGEEVYRIVTEELKPLLGPNRDFHRQEITPQDLGYKTITILQTGKDRTERFSGQEKIVLPLEQDDLSSDDDD